MNHSRRKSICRLGLCAAALCLAFSLVALAQATAPASQGAPLAAAGEWKAYSYPADGFSASFPSEPELQKRDVPTEKGSFELRSYVAEVTPVALLVGVCDYGTATNGKSPDEVLQGARDGALKNSSSHLVSERNITLGIYRGVAFEAESDAAHFSARIYFVGSTLYQTVVVTPLNQPYPGTTRFLDSFQLIARDQK